MRQRFVWICGLGIWSTLMIGGLLSRGVAEDASPSSAVSSNAGPRGVAAISVPEGFAVELVAGPPLVERPMLASFDDRGRLYVCDSAGVNLRGPELSKNPPHKIRMLEDTDGDGVFDKSTVFADRLVFPQGIVWHQGAVFCSSPPSFWRLEDTDGDGVADKRDELVTGFANTGVADDMHGGSLGPDGRLYWCAGRFPHEIRRPGGPLVHKGTAPLLVRCRPDGTDLEVVCGSQGNAVGVAFTPEGDMFASGTFLAPNAMGAGLRDALIHCVDGGEYPVRDRVLNEHKRTGDLLPPLTHLGVAAASDLTIYRGGNWGPQFEGNLFSALFNMHKITRHKLERAGASFTCRNEDFLVSRDTDFHPTDVLLDADGSLLVIDTGGWFRIGCPTSQLAKPDVMGAIYRVRKRDAAKVPDPRGLAIDWASQTTSQLARLLGDSRPEVRDHAIEKLASLGSNSVTELNKVLQGTGSLETRCAAVWALTRIEDPTARAAVRAVLADREPGVRQAAARSTGIHRDALALAQLMDMTSTDEAPVAREAATALGRLGNPDALPALFTGLNYSSDRFLEHALIFALIRIGDQPHTLKGLQIASSPARRGALIALDQMDGGNLTPEVVTPFLTPSDPLMQQTALWVISHHGEWGQAMVDFFGQWLAHQDAEPQRRDELAQQLLAFSEDRAVQDLIGRSLSDSATPADTRLLLLEVISQSSVSRLPKAWVAPLQQSLADADLRIVRQAVAALRVLPLDKRPLVSRVDATVDFPGVRNRFAGTRLNEHFCVRWQGFVRIDQEGEYSFFTESDDGSQLFIDDALVVDNSGSHAMREREGRVHLTAGNHRLRLEFIQGEGEAGCRLLWARDGSDKEVVPAGVLFHRAVGSSAPSSGNSLLPGLMAEFFELGGRVDKFPEIAASVFDEPLVRIALETSRPLDVRVQAAAAVTTRADVDGPLVDFLLRTLHPDNPPLIRLAAAEALGNARLDERQLTMLAAEVSRAGVLEVPKLLGAFEHSNSATVGLALVFSLRESPGLKSVPASALATVLEAYPAEVRERAQPLFKLLEVDREKQKSRLAELAKVITDGDIQRGRDLFFGNKKAICATCHTVQAQGGKIGPDLSKIGAIRTSADLLEAIVFPSASFARGYEPFTIVTDAGQTHSGIIARETADAVYVFNAARAELRVPRDEIESVVASTTSIMPEGMDAQLSHQELADLIAFLNSLR